MANENSKSTTTKTPKKIEKLKSQNETAENRVPLPASDKQQLVNEEKISKTKKKSTAPIIEKINNKPTTTKELIYFPLKKIETKKFVKKSTILNGVAENLSTEKKPTSIKDNVTVDGSTGRLAPASGPKPLISTRTDFKNLPIFQRTNLSKCLRIELSGGF